LASLDLKSRIGLFGGVSGPRGRMFGLSKAKKLETPLGPAIVRDGFVEVLSWRYRGVLVEVAWPESSPCPVDQFSAIRGDFDRLMQAALTFLGVDEFPPELRTVVP